MQLRIALVVIVLAMRFLGTTSAQLDPSCETSCGNVTIEFPFGSKEGCYLNDRFFVNCSRPSGGADPTLHFRGSSIVVTNISIHESEMQMLMFVANDCYNTTGLTTRNKPFLRSNDFQVSTKNMFIAIGCDTHAYFNGTNGDNKSVGTGCISYCSSKRSLANGSCSGIGCCEIAIPQGMNSFDILLSSYNNHKGILDFNPCSYGFFVERGRYDFLARDLLDFGSVNTKMPMLLEWAIGNESCEEARKNRSSNFLCNGNSECVQEYVGPGYRCRCKDGYQGNPYIQNNCTNINECERRTHVCQHICNDRQGNYSCSCPDGYSGDGRRDGTGCMANKSHVIQIVIDVSAESLSEAPPPTYPIPSPL